MLFGGGFLGISDSINCELVVLTMARNVRNLVLMYRDREYNLASNTSVHGSSYFN